jgi:hypothetical protein
MTNDPLNYQVAHRRFTELFRDLDIEQLRAVVENVGEREIAFSEYLNEAAVRRLISETVANWPPSDPEAETEVCRHRHLTLIRGGVR